MTRSEAVKMLGRLLLYCECPHHDCDKCVEAINMAEEALDQQTCDNCKFNEETDGMSCYECLKGISDNFEALQQEEIIHCEDCKHWHEWENGTGSCHRSDIMWVGSDYCDYCSFAEKRGSDRE